MTNNPMFSPFTYLIRRKELASHLGKGLALLLGNELSSMNYAANYYPQFRQDSTFLYYFGLDVPGLAAIVDLESGESILFGQEPTLDSMVWTGPEAGLDELASKCGVEKTLPIETLGEFLSLTGDRTVHYLPSYRPEHTIKYSTWLKKNSKEVKEGVSEALIHTIIRQRSTKVHAEIEQLDNAANVTHALHMTAMKYAKAGMKESDVVAELYAIAMRETGYPSFPIICTVHGEILHNHHYHNNLKEGDLLLVDCGGESAMHYAGDMTRTFPVSASFTQKQKEVYQAVLDASDQVVINLRPGVSYKEMHLLAARVLTENLKAIGLMKGDVEEAVAHGAHALFFPHGLGHMLGLDVHDMENLGEDFVGYDSTTRRNPQFGLSALRLGKELQAGYAITVEPGCYFIPGLIDNWKASNKLEAFINYEALESYRDFGGIRIEDDYIITENGSRLLGTPVPRTIAEVEEVRGAAL
ncbi:MAG: aminopeptidase P family protein [Bacteroidota bacterium]